MILITGSSGFVGINVSRYFVRKGIQVTGIDIAEPGMKLPDEYFTFQKCDLTNRKSVLNIFEELSPKSVIHLAFVTRPKDIYGEFLDDAKITLNMLDAASKQNVERFLLMSSSTVYGLKPVDSPVNEDDKLSNPRGAYGKAKVVAEIMTKQYMDTEELSATIFRGFEIYGPNLTIPSIVRKLIERAIHKEPMQLFCYGKQKTDFTYVEDLARAMEIVLKDPRAVGETFNAGSGKIYTYEEFAKAICKILPAEIELLPPRPNEKPFFLYSDIKKLKALDFQPKYDIEEGLKNTIDWLLTANG